MLKISHRFLSVVRSPRLSYRPLGVETHDPRKVHWSGLSRGGNEACFFPERVGGFPWVYLPRRLRQRRGDIIRGSSWTVFPATMSCSIFTLPMGHRSRGPRKLYIPGISAERVVTQGNEEKLQSKGMVQSNGYGTQQSRSAGSVPSVFSTDTARREFELLVTSLGRNSHWNRVIIAYREALDDPDLKLSGSMYKATIVALSGRSRWQEALSVMRDMQTAGLDPDLGAFNHVIRACIDSSQVEQAFSLFEEMKARRVAPNATTYHHLLKGCRDGMWEKALNLLAAMEESGLNISAKHLNSVIAACGSSGELERALDTLQEMRTRGVAPTHGTYREVILACEKGGQWERALSLLERMEHDNLVPNDYCYNAAIAVCLAASRWSEALSLLEQALSEEENTDTINFEGVALACAEAGKVDEARELVRKMRAARRVVNQNLINVVDHADASEQEQRGNGKAGAKVSSASKVRIRSSRSSRKPGGNPVHWMRDEGSEGLAMRELTAGEAGSTENDKASHPQGKPVRLWSPPYTERKFVQCVNACSNRGRRRTLIHLLKDAIATPELRFTVHMYESVLRTFAKLGMPRQAIGVLGWMRESGLTPSSRCIVWAIRACSETRPVNANLALSLLKEMNPPDTWGYAAALSVLATGRQWKKGLSLLDEMPASGVQPNAHCYGAAMAACYRAAPVRWKEVLGLLEQMKAQGLRPNNVIFDTAIRACLSGGQSEAARGLVDEMLDSGYKPFPELMTRVAIASSS